VPTIVLETVPQPLLYAGYWYDRELGLPGESTPAQPARMVRIFIV
jgi:hypothetical protein